MRGISDTIARLAAAAKRRDEGIGVAGSPMAELKAFGPNPGALDAYIYVPAGLGAGAPLVVVLHGCTQSASQYDVGSGWSQLADELGFALLYPQQRRGNNMNLCFNWFEQRDTRRGTGEAQSIRQMIAAVQERLSSDPSRIFITGLSAGGAMASAMLAAYPEVFAGGAIIAGVAYGAAEGMVQAFDRMRGHGLPAVDILADRVRRAAPDGGRWPRISIWQGMADTTVVPENAAAIGNQWRTLHGLSDRPDEVESIDGIPRRAWHGSGGKALIEEYLVPRMGHGTPVRTSTPGAYGRSGSYMLDVGISSTFRIAEFWGLVFTRKAEPAEALPSAAVPLPAVTQPNRIYGQRVGGSSPTSGGVGITKVIEDAFRTAGLMK